MHTTPFSLILAVTFTLPAAADGQQRLPRAALVQSLRPGVQFQSGGRTYRFLGAARALRRQHGAPAEDVLTKAGLPSAEVVETKRGFVLVRHQGAQSAQATAHRVGSARVLPVVVNTRTQQLGVVLGTIVARLRAPEDSAALAREHGLRLVRAAPHLSVAFLEVPDGKDIWKAASSLAADPRVTSAEIEVQESTAVPR